jgi:hypothetical protein
MEPCRRPLFLGKLRQQLAPLQPEEPEEPEEPETVVAEMEDFAGGLGAFGGAILDGDLRPPGRGLEPEDAEDRLAAGTKNTMEGGVGVVGVPEEVGRRE